MAGEKAWQQFAAKRVRENAKRQLLLKELAKFQKLRAKLHAKLEKAGLCGSCGLERIEGYCPHCDKDAR